MHLHASRAALLFPPRLQVPPSQLAARLAFCNRTAHIRGDNCPPRAVTRIDWLRPDVNVREGTSVRRADAVQVVARPHADAAADMARKPYAPPPLGQAPGHTAPAPAEPVQPTVFVNYLHVSNRGSLVDMLA